MIKNCYKLLFVALIGTFCFASCKKDGKPTIVATSNGLEMYAGGKTYLVSKLTVVGGDYANISYDSNGRLTKYSTADGSSHTIIYDGNSITINSGDNKTNTSIKLGANGFKETEITTELDPFGSYTNITKTTSKFTQNSEGYLTKQEDLTVHTSNNPNFKSDSYAETSDFTYLNGNLKSAVTKDDYVTRTAEYEYYSDKPQISLLFDLKLLAYLAGKTSKNAIKKVTSTVVAPPQLSKMESNVSYNFNEKGLPITVNVSGTDKLAINLEYIEK